MAEPTMTRSEGGAELSSLLVGGEECQTYDDAPHAKLRAAAGVPDDFLTAFDWKTFAPGGGKGGNLMAFTADRKYLVKEVNSTDHKQMRKIISAYTEHVLSEEGSLLAHIYAHIERPSTKHVMLVMNNFLPKLGEDPGVGTLGVYDLKGCNDDKTMVEKGEEVEAVHKRFSQPHMWFGKGAWSPARHKYYDGKLFARKASFVVSKPAHAWLIQRIERDCKFCEKHNLMDYSMILSHRTLPASDAAALEKYKGTGQLGQQPLICTKGETAHIIYCGIIDFLQPWVFAKKIAKQIKSLEPNKATEPPPFYANRFLENFANKFVGEGTDIEKV